MLNCRLPVTEARPACHFGTPMISLAGDFPLFHTPEDTAANATTPYLLERVEEVLGNALRTILT